MAIKRKLLFVTQTPLWHRSLGSHTRMASMIDLLSHRYEVVKVAIAAGKKFGKPEDWGVIELPVNFDQAIKSPELHQFFRELIRKNHIDVVYFNYYYFFPLARALSDSVTKVCDIHDVQYLRALSFAEQGEKATFEISKTAEIKALQAFDVIVSINPNESKYLKEHLDIPVVTIPHITEAVSLKFKTHRYPLMVGSLAKPNVDGFRKFLLPAFKEGILTEPVLLAGAISKHTAEEGTGLAIPLGHFESPAAIYPHASASIAPIRYGGGLKVKVIESLAHGVPVAGTRCAFDGIPELPSDIFLQIESYRDLSRLNSFVSKTDVNRVLEFASTYYGPSNYLDSIAF